MKDKKIKILINDEIEIELYQSQIDLIEKTVKGKDLSEKFENILKKYLKKDKYSKFDSCHDVDDYYKEYESKTFVLNKNQVEQLENWIETLPLKYKNKKIEYIFWSESGIGIAIRARIGKKEIDLTDVSEW